MKIRIAAVLLLISSALWAQNRTLSGYITDFETGEALIGVNVWAPELKLGTSSNNYGFYSLTLPKGTHVVRLTYLGYDNNQFEVDLSKNVDFDFRLKPSDNMLNEVDVVAAEGQKIQEQVQMSKMEVPIKQLKSLPAILGEVDIMKTLTAIAWGAKRWRRYFRLVRPWWLAGSKPHPFGRCTLVQCQPPLRFLLGLQCRCYFKR